MNKPNNIILLTIDALRIDHLSFTGFHRNTSPNIDKLASDSLVFENAISPSSHTREALPSILTGTYPDESTSEKYHLTGETIAAVLQRRSFETAGFHSNPFASRAYRFDEGFDSFFDDLYLGQNKAVAIAQRLWDKFRNRHYVRANSINERALTWIDSLENNERFFLWNHYMDTHGPYQPPEPYRSKFESGDVDDIDENRLYRRTVDEPETVTEDERRTQLDLYDAEIAYLDAQIGAFFNELKIRDLLSETLVIFTADHGELFGEHGFFSHPRYLFDELVFVPLLITGCGVESNSISVPVSTLDLFPSITEAAIGEDRNLPGQSVWAIEESPSSYRDRIVFSQARGDKDGKHLRRYSARSINQTANATVDLRTGEVQCIEGPAPVRDALENHILERSSFNHKPKTTQGTGPISKEIEQRLESLGYK